MSTSPSLSTSLLFLCYVLVNFASCICLCPLTLSLSQGLPSLEAIQLNHLGISRARICMFRRHSMALIALCLQILLTCSVPGRDCYYFAVVYNLGRQPIFWIVIPIWPNIQTPLLDVSIPLAASRYWRQNKKGTYYFRLLYKGFGQCTELVSRLSALSRR